MLRKGRVDATSASIPLISKKNQTKTIMRLFYPGHILAEKARTITLGLKGGFVPVFLVRILVG